MKSTKSKCLYISREVDYLRDSLENMRQNVIFTFIPISKILIWKILNFYYFHDLSLNFGDKHQSLWITNMWSRETASEPPHNFKEKGMYRQLIYTRSQYLYLVQTSIVVKFLFLERVNLFYLYCGDTHQSLWITRNVIMRNCLWATEN